MTLTWRAPTTNTDGTPLTDLAGFVVYCWEPGAIPRPTLEIDDPTVTEATVQLDPGPWTCSVTARNAAGEQSYYSNEGTVTVPEW